MKVSFHMDDGRRMLCFEPESQHDRDCLNSFPEGECLYRKPSRPIVSVINRAYMRIYTNLSSTPLRTPPEKVEG